MSEPIKPVNVAVVLITDATGGRLLVDYSPKWNCFTFPMTKVDGAVVSIQTLLSIIPLTGVEPLAIKPNIKSLQLLLK